VNGGWLVNVFLLWFELRGGEQGYKYQDRRENVWK